MPPPNPYRGEYPAAIQARVAPALVEAMEMTAEEGVLHAANAFLAGASELGISGVWSLDNIAREVREFFAHVASNQEGIAMRDLEQRMYALDAYRQAIREVAKAHLDAVVDPATPAPKKTTRAKRLSSTVSSTAAARRMTAYIETKGIKLADFASKVGTTDRTLRTFRNTGRLRHDLFEAVAVAMGTTRKDLLKPETE
jgi:hypothetical protein